MTIAEKGLIGEGRAATEKQTPAEKAAKRARDAEALARANRSVAIYDARKPPATPVYHQSFGTITPGLYTGVSFGTSYPQAYMGTVAPYRCQFCSSLYPHRHGEDTAL